MGRRRRGLNTSPPHPSDSLFVSERQDGHVFEGQTFEHCTFANISFKESQILECRFVDCVFMECYFRETEIKHSQFLGCKFLNCDLSKVDIIDCDFKYYTRFRDCYIGYNKMQPNLPSELNLRASLCRNLAREAHKEGQLVESGAFRQQSAAAWEAHMWNAVAGAWRDNRHYKEHYSGRRWNALSSLLSSKLQGLLWGYKRSEFVVARNAAVLGVIAFPLLLIWAGRGVYYDHRPLAGLQDFGPALLVSSRNLLQGVPIVEVTYVTGWARLVGGLEGAPGLLLIGLIASLLFRAVFERWR
jgi:hypothetical protein